MNIKSPHFKNLLTKPIKSLIKDFSDTVHLLSPIKNDNYKRNIKYSIEDYIIGIIDVLKNNASWKKMGVKHPFFIMKLKSM